MKNKIFFIALICGFISTCLFAQKRKEVDFYTTGPVAPLNTAYADYISYKSEFKFPDSMTEYCKTNKIGFSPSNIEKKLVVLPGLKNIDSGDYKVVFDITKFKFIEYTTTSKIPTVVLGLEANLKIYDKELNLIFERYLAPTTNSYLYSSNNSIENVFYMILLKQYENLSKDFKYYFMYGPIIKTKVIGLEKVEKVAGFDDYASSVEVFSALNDIRKSDYAETLGGTIAYWKGFLAYKKDKNNDINMDVRMSAYYNTAMALILQDKIEDAQKLLSLIKANDRKFLGSTFNFGRIDNLIKEVKEYRANINDHKNITPLQVSPQISTTKYADNIFEFMAFDNAEITTTKDKIYKGIVKVYYDHPVMVDLQTSTTTTDGPQTGLGMAVSLLKAIKSDNCSVRVEIDGQKKPTKLKLDDISKIRTEDGKIFEVAEVGFLETKRFALLENVKGNAKVSYYEEKFPGNESVLKRANKEEYFQIAEFNSKKSLKTFFSDCPKLNPKIDAGEYGSGDNSTYLRLINDYLSLCGGVKK